jgi:hypothetical protein
MRFLRWALQGFRSIKRLSIPSGKPEASSTTLSNGSESSLSRVNANRSSEPSALSGLRESKPHPFSRIAIAPGYCQVCLTEIIDGACRCGTYNEIHYGQRHRPGDGVIEGECSTPGTTRSFQSDAVSTTPAAELEKANTTRSAALPSRPASETAEATRSIVPGAANRLQNVSRSLALARKNGSERTRRNLVPNGKLLMPGERRNGHILSCTCADCRKLVEADAERYFKRGLVE